MPGGLIGFTSVAFEEPQMMPQSTFNFYSLWPNTVNIRKSVVLIVNETKWKFRALAWVIVGKALAVYGHLHHCPPHIGDIKPLDCSTRVIGTGT